MPELRRDPVLGRWIIISKERRKRPTDFLVEPVQGSGGFCPLCPGNESFTPPEVYAFRYRNSVSNAPDWQVRVVPNKFPVLRIEGELNQRAEGLYRAMRGIGAHEVIIETVEHQHTIAHLGVAEIAEVLKAYRSRLIDLRKDLRFRYLQIFKNHGVEAGAPMPHSHSQLMAVPITPPVIRSELNSCRAHYHTTGRCLICDILAQEIADGRRVIFNDGRFIVLAPYASCFPFELKLLPIQHNHDFALQDDEELMACARALQEMLRRLFKLLEDPPYNFILHTAPPINAQPPKPGYWETLPQDYHWHIELVPRLNQIAGFEWGSGFFINPLPPEDAANFLRDTDPDLSF